MTTFIRKPCPDCVGAGKPSSTRVTDYVRGDRTEFCARCDGDGFLRVRESDWSGVEIAQHTSAVIRGDVQ